VCAGDHGFAGQQNREWALYGTDGHLPGDLSLPHGSGASAAINFYYSDDFGNVRFLYFLLKQNAYLVATDTLRVCA
jgi:hypothetical protein